MWLEQFVIIYYRAIWSVLCGYSWAALASLPALVLDKEEWMRAGVGYGHDDTHNPVPFRWCDPGDSEPVVVPGEVVLRPALCESRRWEETQCSMASPSCPYTGCSLGTDRTVTHHCGFFAFLTSVGQVRLRLVAAWRPEIAKACFWSVNGICCMKGHAVMCMDTEREKTHSWTVWAMIMQCQPSALNLINISPRLTKSL